MARLFRSHIAVRRRARIAALCTAGVLVLALIVSAFAVGRPPSSRPTPGDASRLQALQFALYSAFPMFTPAANRPNDHAPAETPVDGEPNPRMQRVVPLHDHAITQSSTTPGSKSGTSANSLTPSSGNEKASSGSARVYIYHTHNRESFIPELSGVTSADEAYDPKINITQVGNRLAADLDRLGIPTVHTTTDYWNMGPYSNEYAYSRQTVKQVLAEQPNLQLIIDMHRDSGPRDQTTMTIGGKPTAGIFLIVGGQNPNWEANKALADKLKAILDSVYPGLCRGVWVKDSNSYDTRYNQDLSPDSVLIEMGGPYNTFDELDRSADDLSVAIKKYLTQIPASKEVS